MAEKIVPTDENTILIHPQCRLVTMSIIYGLPDHKSIINEFVWQLHDLVPELERVRRFLKFWDNNIDGPIKLVQITYPGIKIPRSVRCVDSLLVIN